MSIVTFASVKGSPGATTTAALVAARWPADRVLVECDETGGVLAARLGLGALPSSLELAATTPLAAEALRRHLQHEWLDVPVLVAPRAPNQVTATLKELNCKLGELCHAAGTDLILDAGRLTSTSPAWALIERSSVTVLVARPRLDEFAAIAGRAAELRRAGLRIVLAAVLDGPYDADEFATTADIELVGSVPFDAAALADISAGRLSRRASRSVLWQRVAVLAETLAAITSDAAVREWH